MSDENIIAEAVHSYQMGNTITDLQAKVIANAWHGGQSSDMYALTSTGTIRTDFDPGFGDNRLDEPEIMALMHYVHTLGPRGPVNNWSNLSW